jgi:hypothetical protein
MEKKQAAIEEANALIEMFKAGFVDGYTTHHKPKNKKDWDQLNVFYKLAFMKRFEKKIDQELKNRVKLKK